MPSSWRLQVVSAREVKHGDFFGLDAYVKLSIRAYTTRTREKACKNHEVEWNEDLRLPSMGENEEVRVELLDKELIRSKVIGSAVTTLCELCSTSSDDAQWRTCELLLRTKKHKNAAILKIRLKEDRTVPLLCTPKSLTKLVVHVKRATHLCEDLIAANRTAYVRLEFKSTDFTAVSPCVQTRDVVVQADGYALFDDIVELPETRLPILHAQIVDSNGKLYGEDFFDLRSREINREPDSYRMIVRDEHRASAGVLHCSLSRIPANEPTPSRSIRSRVRMEEVDEEVVDYVSITVHGASSLADDLLYQLSMKWGRQKFQTPTQRVVDSEVVWNYTIRASLVPEPLEFELYECSTSEQQQHAYTVCRDWSERLETTQPTIILLRKDPPIQLKLTANVVKKMTRTKRPVRTTEAVVTVPVTGPVSDPSASSETVQIPHVVPERVRSKSEPPLDRSSDVSDPPAEVDVSGLECVVCCANIKSILMIPCRHVCCCSTCAKRLKACPICRARIEHRLEIYL